MSDGDDRNTPFALIDERRSPYDAQPLDLFGVLVTNTVRTSGFLAELPPEDLQSFLFLLSFVARHGLPRANTHQLANAMGLTRWQSYRRMKRLTKVLWENVPIVSEVRLDSREVAFLISNRVLGLRAADPKPAPQPPRKPLDAAAPDNIVARSRKTFATPRAHVERRVAEYMGWDIRQRQEDERARQTRQGLKALGLTDQRVDELFNRNGVDEAARQLGWLPLRKPKNPARLIVDAIIKRYDAPIRQRYKRSADPQADKVEGL